MDIHLQSKKADQLRKLHQGPRILVFPNAWDVASARIIEDLGYPAIATSSSAVAATLGYADGERITRDEMLEAVARISAAVHVPVTADMESGYGASVEDMADTARAIVSAGAVGLNLEDVVAEDARTHVNINLQVEKIRSIREASASAGVSLVINARTDIYLIPIGEEPTRFDRTVERLRAYRQAGADCLFAPGVKDRDTIGKLVRAVAAPLNILVMPGVPAIPELEKLGVARASLGSAPMRSALGHLRGTVRRLLETGDYAAVMEGAISFAEVNALFERPS
jgi:2-methylisocitrate lyase-like PEP mutase family enzyme